MSSTLRLPSIIAVLLAAVATLSAQQSSPQAPNQDSFRFKSGVELINVTATVSDSNGRFVPGLTKDDFIVYEDDVRQTVSQFSAERVPVSLAKDQDVTERFSLAAGDKRFAAAANGQLFHVVGRKALQKLDSVAASHMKNSAAG